MKKPKDTWELADQLEKLAKTLKNSPKLTFSSKTEDLTQLNRKLSTTTSDHDYSKLKVEELRLQCRQRKINLPSGYVRKKELIKLLQDNDRGRTTLSKISKAFESP